LGVAIATGVGMATIDLGPGMMMLGGVVATLSTVLGMTALTAGVAGVAASSKISKQQRIGAWLEGRHLIFDGKRGRYVFDLSAADMRLDWRQAIERKIVTTTTPGTSGYGGSYIHSTAPRTSYSTVDVPVGQLPSLFLRVDADDEWKALPLHNVAGKILPKQQLVAIAAVIEQNRPPDDAQAQETAAALRALADTHNPYRPS
jgi:hypothetical protein